MSETHSRYRVANYEIIEDTPIRMVIRDLGPWDQHKTITENAENVVRDLWLNHKLYDRRLFYYDKQGDFGEIKHNAAQHTGFVWGFDKPIGFEEAEPLTDSDLEEIAAHLSSFRLRGGKKIHESDLAKEILKLRGELREQTSEVTG
jgi:hypothetical protein